VLGAVLPRLRDFVEHPVGDHALGPRAQPVQVRVFVRQR
jgi:hypothetical protein